MGTNYNDPSTNNFPDDYDESKVDSRTALRAKAIREKMYGKDVREAIAEGVEISSVVSGEANANADDALEIANDTKARFDNEIAGSDNVSEVVDARHSNVKNKNFTVLTDRLEETEQEVKTNTSSLTDLKKNKANSTDKSGIADNAHLFEGNSLQAVMGHRLKVGTRFFAHRGAQKIAPENSLPAIRKVANHVGVEIDIHQTADGTWVVMHDGNIDRMTAKTGAISSYKFADLRKILISKGTNVGKYRDDELVIPTLEEVLTICKDKRLVPVVEIKVDTTDQYTDASWDSLANIIHKFGVADAMMFISFNLDALKAIKKRLPLVEVSYLVSELSDSLIADAQSLGVNSGLDVDYNNASVTADNVTKAHKASLKVGVWTLEDDSKRMNMLSLGVDFITTNSQSGELRYEELTLQNGWVNYPEAGVSAYVTEISPGKIQLRFIIRGGKRDKGTVIADLPDWATPNSQVWSPAMIRIWESGGPMTMGSFDVTNESIEASHILVGFNWTAGISTQPGDWVEGNVTYYRG